MSEMITTPIERTLLDAIDLQLGEAAKNEILLEKCWMQLGGLLLKCKQDECWRKGGFESFEQYMLSLRDKYRRGKTALWGYLTVAEHLAPVIEEPKLLEMGITKALELKRGMKKSGKPIPEDIIAAALLPENSAKDLRALFAKAFNIPPDENSTWWDLDGIFVTPEQREQFKAAVRLTKNILNIENHVPAHIQRHAIYFAWIAEFMGTHAAEVYGPKDVSSPSVLILPPAPKLVSEQQDAPTIAQDFDGF